MLSSGKGFDNLTDSMPMNKRGHAREHYHAAKKRIRARAMQYTKRNKESCGTGIIALCHYLGIHWSYLKNVVTTEFVAMRCGHKSVEPKFMPHEIHKMTRAHFFTMGAWLLVTRPCW